MPIGTERGNQPPIVVGSYINTFYLAHFLSSISTVRVFIGEQASITEFREKKEKAMDRVKEKGGRYPPFEFDFDIFSLCISRSRRLLRSYQLTAESRPWWRSDMILEGMHLQRQRWHYGNSGEDTQLTYINGANILHQPFDCPLEFREIF